MKRIMERLMDMSPSGIATTAVVVGTGTFIGWLVVLRFSWRVGNFAGINSNAWAYIEAMSAIAVLATAIGGGLVVLVQLVELIDSRKRNITMNSLQTYDAVFTLMMNDDNIAARRWIYQSLPGDPQQGLQDLKPDDLRKIKLVLNSLDYLGMLVSHDDFTSDPIVEWASPFVVKVWEKLGPYVENEAQRRNEPDYYEAACKLAERCQEMRKKRFPDITWKKVEDAL